MFLDMLASASCMPTFGSLELAYGLLILGSHGPTVDAYPMLLGEAFGSVQVIGQQWIQTIHLVKKPIASIAPVARCRHFQTG